LLIDPEENIIKPQGKSIKFTKTDEDEKSFTSKKDSQINYWRQNYLNLH